MRQLIFNRNRVFIEFRRKSLIPCLFFLLILSSFPSYSNHLLGGDITYSYEKDTLISGVKNYKYEVSLTLFFDCGGTSTFNPNNPSPSVLPAFTDIKIFEAPLNSSSLIAPTAVRLNLNPSDTGLLNIDLPSNCASNASCTYKISYKSFVFLKATTKGYHFVYDVCCRSTSVSNLSVTPTGNNGSVLHTWMNSSQSGNSSPKFVDFALSTFCTAKEESLANYAFEANNDRLEFSRHSPYDGNAISTSPHPGAYSSWPPSLAAYKANFSTTEPLGVNQIANIDSLTGITNIKSNSSGNYVLGYQVKEFDKQNKVIGVVKREIQISVTSCSVDTNKAPIKVKPTQAFFKVDPRETLTFDVEFKDPDGSLKNGSHRVSGAILDSKYQKPSATLSAPQYGSTDVKQTFTWTPDCAQASENPYQLHLQSTDVGCLPKANNQAVLVEVTPPKKPKSISGPTQLGKQLNGFVYAVDTIPGYGFTWKVSNGTIVSGSSSKSIVVNWNPGGGSIQVQAISPKGCLSDQLSLSARAGLFPVNAGKDTTICAGDTIILGGSAGLPTAPTGFRIKWSPSTFFVNPGDTNMPNPKVVVTSKMRYILLVTNPNDNSTERDTINITIKKIPGVGAGKDTTICGNQQAVLKSFGGKFYSWSPSNLVLLPNDSISPTKILSASQNFVVTIKGDKGFCTQIDTMRVNVFSKSSISAGRDTNICGADTFFLNGMGPSGSTFLWKPGTNLSDSTIAQPQFLGALPDTITYVLTVSNGGTCSLKDTVVVGRVAYPVLTTILRRGQICAGQRDSIAVIGAFDYLWNIPMDSVLGFGTNKYKTNAGVIKPDTTTTYVVTGTNQAGCSSKDSATVIVNSSPKIEMLGDSVFLCKGDSLILTATKGAKKYKWSPNTFLLPNDSVDSIKVFPTVSTRYFLRADSLGVCSARDTIMVLVDTIIPTDAGPATLQVCAGDTFTLGGNPTTMASNATYSWTPALLVTHPNDSSTRAFTNADTTFKVITQIGKCKGEDSVKVTLKVKPTITFTQDTYKICSGDTALFVVASEGVITKYAWTPTSTLSDSTIKNPKAFPATFTKYTITITHPNGCTNTKSVSVSMDGQSNISISGDTVGCSGASFQLLARGSSKVKWTPSTGLNNDSILNPIATLDSSMKYVVTGLGSGNCSSKDSIFIRIKPASKIDAGDTIISCDADTVRLGGNPTAPPKSQYAWSSPEVLDSSFVANPTSFYTLNRVYYLLVVDSNGCESIDSATVLRYSINAKASDLDCSKDSVVLDVTSVDGVKPFTYRWFPNYNLSNPSAKSPKARPDSTFVYSVEVIDSMGCRDSVRVEVPIINPVKAIFDVKVQAACDDALATTNNTSSNGVSYVWYVDGSKFSEEYNARIPLAFGSTKTISLLAKNAEGCSDSSFALQEVKAFEDYFDGVIPNVFTPNNDDINDEFDIQLGQRLEQCAEIRIYNRWGQLMFESRGADHTWDGRTFTGEECDGGTYFYVLNINGTTYKGHLTLVR
ncbi:MAG: gliding motility-associated C-terminal domain-containing protein [Flavobacteriales bacterium]|nr:gliding motility-associated C-terminal domain-containing protein [Flavobacteriales bacterium]